MIPNEALRNKKKISFLAIGRLHSARPISYGWIHLVGFSQLFEMEGVFFQVLFFLLRILFFLFSSLLLGFSCCLLASVAFWLLWLLWLLAFLASVAFWLLWLFGFCGLLVAVGHLLGCGRFFFGTHFLRHVTPCSFHFYFGTLMTCTTRPRSFWGAARPPPNPLPLSFVL